MEIYSKGLTLNNVELELWFHYLGPETLLLLSIPIDTIKNRYFCFCDVLKECLLRSGIGSHDSSEVIG